MTDAEIAKRLRISPRTARMHCDVLRTRLRVEKRRQIPYAYHLLLGSEPFEMAPPEPPASLTLPAKSQERGQTEVS